MHGMYEYLCHQTIQYEFHEWIWIEDGEVSLTLERGPDAETGGRGDETILGRLVVETRGTGREIRPGLLFIRSMDCQSVDIEIIIECQISFPLPCHN